MQGVHPRIASGGGRGLARSRRNPRAPQAYRVPHLQRPGYELDCYTQQPGEVLPPRQGAKEVKLHVTR
jgi:hypothetical protein